MSMISKQIEELRSYAKDRKGELAKLINDAADTIEMLSEKLHASNMERSRQYYNGGWIPCSERLPEEYGEYICTMENGQVEECGFVPEKQKGLIAGWSTCEADGHKFLRNKDVLAWMPLPEPYSERRTDETR